MEERVRIVDIAEELGVSSATVSNVIHGKTKKISKETVKRVQQLLEEKNYIPSMAGILLARNSSKIIGVVVNNHSKYEKRVLQDPFISATLDYLLEQIEEKNYFMMVKSTNKVGDIIEFASMWNMEGLVIVGFCEQDYQMLRNEMHIPFVVYDGYFDTMSRYANISVDNYGGGYQVGEYLYQMGHRRILYIADNKICMDKERYLGMKKALQEKDCIEVETEYLEIPMKGLDRKQFFQQQLEKIREYTAIFAASDVYAIEIMNFLIDHGIAVPEEISIVGFDDISEGSAVRPTLTTMRQDGKLRAEWAIEMLLMQRKHAIKGESRTLPVQLIQRESVKNRNIG